jgi:hypothetical protein
MDHKHSTRRTALLLLLLFIANALLALSTYPLLFDYHRSRTAPPDWIGVLRMGAFAGQLFTVSLVGAMAEKRRWAMWLSVLPFAWILTLGILPDVDHNWIRLLVFLIDQFQNVPLVTVQLLVLFFAHLMAPLCMILAGILLLSVICWPVKVFCGWRLIDRDYSDPCANRRVSTWQLMLWIGLWGALFCIYTQVREYFGTNWVVAALISVPAVLIVGIPVAMLCAGPRIRWYTWLAIPVYVLGLSYAESELTYLVASVSAPGSAGIPLVYPLFFNGTVAVVVGGNLLIMREFGLRLHTPLRNVAKPPPARAATDSSADLPGTVP